MDKPNGKTVGEFLSRWKLNNEGHSLSPELVLSVNKRLRQFAAAQARRYALTLGIIRKASSGERLLEIGSAPYLMSLLLRHLLGYDAVHTNLSHDSQLPALVSFVNAASAESSRFSWDELNVELDRFPYPNKAFEAVVCCEVIEHLTLSPVHMLSEIHRVLKDNGLLILTTPIRSDCQMCVVL